MSALPPPAWVESCCGPIIGCVATTLRDGTVLELELRNQPDPTVLTFTDDDNNDRDFIHPGDPWPHPLTVTVSHPSADELRERMRLAIVGTGHTYTELVERHRQGVLSGAEWEAWETVEQATFLLNIFHPY